MIHSKLPFFRERNTREKATSKIRLHPALKSRLHHAKFGECKKKHLFKESPIDVYINRLHRLLSLFILCYIWMP